MGYAELLKDPRWQKKRLEAFQHYGWACQYCQDEKMTLHVHHKNYVGEPWDSPLEDLAVLCERCHKTEHNKEMYFESISLLIDELVRMGISAFRANLIGLYIKKYPKDAEKILTQMSERSMIPQEKWED